MTKHGGYGAYQVYLQFGKKISGTPSGWRSSGQGATNVPNAIKKAQKLSEQYGVPARVQAWFADEDIDKVYWTTEDGFTEFGEQYMKYHKEARWGEPTRLLTCDFCGWKGSESKADKEYESNDDCDFEPACWILHCPECGQEIGTAEYNQNEPEEWSAKGPWSLRPAASIKEIAMDEDKLEAVISKVLREVLGEEEEPFDELQEDGIEDDAEQWQTDIAEIGQQLIDLKLNPVSSIDEAIDQLADCIDQLDDILSDLEEEENE